MRSVAVSKASRRGRAAVAGQRVARLMRASVRRRLPCDHRRRCSCDPGMRRRAGLCALRGAGRAAPRQPRRTCCRPRSSRPCSAHACRARPCRCWCRRPAAARTRLSLATRDQPVNPASLAKLLTTYAALDQLGPACTWTTPVWLHGPGAATACSTATLHIQGSGDPKLVLERLWLLLRARAAAGRARDPRRHRARPQRLRRARGSTRPTSTASRCGPTTCARRAAAELQRR